MNNISRETLAAEYYGKDKTMAQVGESLGVSTGLVCNLMKKYGLKPRVGMTKKGYESFAQKVKGRVGPMRGRRQTEEAKRKLSEARKGKFVKPSRFGGHTRVRKDGYVEVYAPDNVMANVGGYVMEHHFVMSEIIGRPIDRGEVVHHINHDKKDNRPDNLKLMSHSEHAALHMAERRRSNSVRLATKPVRNITTGEYFKSITEAAKHYGCSTTTIRKCCRTGCEYKNCKWERVI